MEPAGIVAAFMAAPLRPLNRIALDDLDSICDDLDSGALQPADDVMCPFVRENVGACVCVDAMSWDDLDSGALQPADT